jgi:hypothetical protein
LSRAVAILGGALLICALAVGGCGGGGGGSESSTTGAALSSCNISGRQQQLGASYVTSIQVAKVSCSDAERVVVAYHHCRLTNGGPGGTCKSAVRGYSCSEGSRQSVPGVQYNATVDCRKGESEIKSAYTQNF